MRKPCRRLQVTNKRPIFCHLALQYASILRFTRVETESEPQQPVDTRADCQIQDCTPIGVETVMPQRVREIGSERERVDRVADQDSDEVFEPPAGGGTQKLPLPRHTYVPLHA
jgi:hypothetical protein